MPSFYKHKPLYTKVWKNRTTGITGTDSVRACINNNKENFSIDVAFYKREDHLAEKKPDMLDLALIEVELPNGTTWRGCIADLQKALSDTGNCIPF